MATATATETIADVLNRQIANWSVLYVKLHNYHWFVTGDHFYELHAKFEELYDEAAAYIDELAERLLALNGKPVATMREFLQQAAITEATGNETPQQMVQNIANDFRTMIDDLKRGIKTANENHDDSTADMLTGMRTKMEKHLWMLNAFLGR
ncbi:Dps family protein [Bacillaceae bacterium]